MIELLIVCGWVGGDQNYKWLTVAVDYYYYYYYYDYHYYYYDYDYYYYYYHCVPQTAPRDMN